MVGMTTETDEEEAQEASLSDYDITEESENQDEWPAVQQVEVSCLLCESEGFSLLLTAFSGSVT